MAALFSFGKKSKEERNVDTQQQGVNYVGNLLEWFGSLIGSDSGTGITVNQATALKLSAVFGSVRNLAEDIAKLPIHLMEEKDGKRLKVNTNASYLVNMAPNEIMNPFDMKQALIACAAMWGNGYAHIRRDALGQPEGLDFYHPTTVNPQKVNRRIYYLIPGVGTVSADDVIHIKGMNFNGVKGMSIVAYAAESMGVSLAAQRFGAKFFGNGANMQGFFSSPNSLSQTAYDRLKESLIKKNEGLEKSHKTQLLEEGITYNRIGIPPNDAQFLQTREFGIDEICRWFRMPPHKLMHMGRATHANVEHMAMEYVTDTLMPWITRLEEEFNKKLLTEEQKKTQYFKVNVNALLRGDSAARAEMYKSLWGIAAINANEIRELEEMNSQGAQGDKYYVPLNSIPADQAGNYHASKTQTRHEHE
jgi:HK97 family phage portal protein